MASARQRAISVVLTALLPALACGQVAVNAAGVSVNVPAPVGVSVNVPGGGAQSRASSSAQAPGCSYSLYRADLDGSKDIAPNSTTPAPLNTPANAVYFLCLDKSGRERAQWQLQLCDIQNYVASHLHVGSPRQDYAPPLVPLEPYVRPNYVGEPPTQLPMLNPPLSVTGCTTRSGSFSDGDIIPLPGLTSSGVPPVSNFNDFVSQLDQGNIYINVHTMQNPQGEIRGNLFSASSSPPAAGRRLMRA